MSDRAALSPQQVQSGDRGPGSWEKLGRVYVAAGEQPWAQSHASLPTPMMLDEKRIRIFVAFLDANKVGRLGAVDVDARDPRRVLAVTDRPLLDVGAVGTFDESGVTPMWILNHDGRTYLYYTGWQLGPTVRYSLFTGLAISDDGGNTFQRASQVPLLDRIDGELFFRTAVCLMRDADRWKMWYIAGDRWIDHEGKQLPVYDLHYLESSDPRRWPGRGRPILAFDDVGDDEHGLGRPYVVKEGDRFRMWYSIRSLSRGYRLGYAESSDGLRWKRMDQQLGLGVSPSGWDSQMVCYSALQRTKFGTYLFFNGNNFGETGFGVAVQR